MPHTDFLIDIYYNHYMNSMKYAPLVLLVQNLIQVGSSFFAYLVIWSKYKPLSAEHDEYLYCVETTQGKVYIYRCFAMFYVL